MSEGAVSFVLTAELAEDRVLLALRAVSAPTDDDRFSGFLLRQTNAEDANRWVQVVLPEPVAGRPIVDAWTPPPPPPAPIRSIRVGAEFGPVAQGRRLFLDSLDLYDGWADLNYRLRPGAAEYDEDAESYDFGITEWEPEAEDDLGTEYESNPGAYGGDETECVGSRDIHPSPPPGATQLTLIVCDTSSDGGRSGSVEVCWVTIPLVE